MVARAAVSSLDLAPPKAWRRFVPLWLRSLIWIDSAENYDAFLSYSWKADSKIAPVIQSIIQQFLRPWYKLRAKTVFRDLSCLPAGSSLEAELFARLDRSKHLIVLASPEAAVSRGMEIEAKYWFGSPRNGQVLIIVTSGKCETWEEIRTRLLPPALRDNLTSEPLWVPLQHWRDKIEADSDNHQVRGELIEDLKQVLLRFYAGRDWGQLRGEERRQRRQLMWFLSAVGSFILALTVTAIGFAWYAGVQWRESQRQLDRANQALATGILADLDLKPGRLLRLTGRQREALWKLATADDGVRAKFISALSASPEDMARIAGGFGKVSRSLGLQWPSAADAEKLLPSAVAALERSSHDETETVGNAFQALAAKLTEPQAQRTFPPLLQRLEKRTWSDYWLLLALPKVLQALKPTEAQAEQALDAMLRQLEEATDDGALQALAKGLQALAPNLTQAQAQRALDGILQKIPKTTRSYILSAFAKGLQALAPKLTEAQAQRGVGGVVQQIANTADPYALEALAEVLHALPAKLTEAQAQHVLAHVLQQFGKTTDPRALEALADGLQALRTNLTEAQSQQALDTILQQIEKTTDFRKLELLAFALEALAAGLAEVQAQQAFDTVLQLIPKIVGACMKGETVCVAPDRALQALARGLQALAARLTEAQAQLTLPTLLQQLSTATDPVVLKALANGLQALATKMAEASARQALDVVLRQIDETDDPYALQALAEALQALPAKPTEAQAQQALARVLQPIREATNSTDSGTFGALGKALEALAAKPTDTQAQQVLDVVLQQIYVTTDSETLQILAETLQGLATKLTQVQAQHALTVAMSSLAWAATEKEAVDWARAVVSLLPTGTDQGETRKLVAAIVYPPAAGPATEVLLDALRARDSIAPRKEVGTAARLTWIAEKYPDQVGHPLCPTPPQPTSLSGLKCPVVEIAGP